MESLTELPPSLERLYGSKPNGESPAEPDMVNHPPHYCQTALECIDVIEGLELGYHAGNVLKYLSRYKHKGGVKDLKKAAWYLARLIEMESAE